MRSLENLIWEDDRLHGAHIAQHSGFGLLGIRELAKEIGATVTIKSTSVEGTTISVQVPLANRS